MVETRILEVGDKINLQYIDSKMNFEIKEFTIIKITDRILVCEALLPTISESDGTWICRETFMVFNGKLRDTKGSLFEIVDTNFRVKCNHLVKPRLLDQQNKIPKFNNFNLHSKKTKNLY